MYSISSAPTPPDLPPVRELITDRATSWQGMPVEWSSHELPPPVFLRRFVLARQHHQRIYLYGLRYELREARVGGESIGDGFFVEYVIVRTSDDAGWIVDRLVQHSSVTYSSGDDRNDYMAAAKVQAASDLSLDAPPRWEIPEDAVWPLVGAEPMRFIGQVTFPENEVTRSYFTWNITAYLFSGRDDRGECFKIVEQEVGAQSAADHYRSEES